MTTTTTTKPDAHSNADERPDTTVLSADQLARLEAARGARDVLENRTRGALFGGGTESAVDVDDAVALAAYVIGGLPDYGLALALAAGGVGSDELEAEDDDRGER